MTKGTSKRILHPTTTIATCDTCGYSTVIVWADPHHLSRTGIRRVPLNHQH